MMMVQPGAPGDPAGDFGQPITTVVNGTFRVHAARLPFFGRNLAMLPSRDGNCELHKPLGRRDVNDD
jgi:hypothetical protein